MVRQAHQPPAMTPRGHRGVVWYWERLYQTGLGALAMADMGEGRGSTGSPTARDDALRFSGDTRAGLSGSLHGSTGSPTVRDDA